jgi:hypothetical protein
MKLFLSLFVALCTTASAFQLSLDIVHQLSHVMDQMHLLADMSVVPEPNFTLEMDSEAIAKQADVLNTAISSKTDLSGNFMAYLDKNPELKGSTSKYISKFIADFPAIKYLYDPFTGPREAIEEWIKSTPDVQGSTSSWFAKNVNVGSVGNLPFIDQTFKNADSAISSDLKQGTTSYLYNSFKNGLGKDVETYINANPELKKTTSEYVMEKFNSVVVPKTQSTLAFLDKSPLAQDTRGLFGKTTSEFVGIFVEKTAKASEPTVGPLVRALTSISDSIGGKLDGTFKQVLDTNADLKLSTSDYITKFFSSSGDSVGDAITSDFGLSPTSRPLTGMQSPNTPGVRMSQMASKGLAVKVDFPEELTNTVNTVVGNVVDITNRAPVALEKAGSSLGEQLSAKGDVLVGNTVGAFTGFSNGIASIGQGIVEIGIPKIVEGTNKIIDPVTKIDLDGVSKSVTDIKIPTEINVDERIVNKFNKFGENIGQWKFFTDDNHMENGFWEQFFGKQVPKFAQEDLPRFAQQDLPKLVDSTSKTALKLSVEAAKQADRLNTELPKVVEATSKTAIKLSEEAVKQADSISKDLPQVIESGAKTAMKLSEEAAKALPK